ncbi:DUF5590 domain-containing protein [Alkalicoccus daliensis]|uniref:Uncharacterized protein YpmB n=1 Tax=Alkalicoccus daliensis TaxID=745820 RepID=A0A1H0ASH9_9BACI|nr:DUF5590 domain-containing protein [Alkalicoccus daliensis]SDN36407.1 Uncharacterized protein YpmB [Alkalicoccus daliensis]
MKAWIVSISLMVAAAVTASLYLLYASATDPMEERQREADVFARESLDFNAVREVTFFHGTHSYQVVDGVNDAGEDVFAWVPEHIEEPSLDMEVQEEEEAEGEEEVMEPVIRLHSEGISAAEALEIAENDADVASLRSVQLGIIGASPVYEVNYRDSDGRFGYYYVAFEDGQYLRRYELAP